MVENTEPDRGCDVCGTVLPPDNPGSYLRLESDDEMFGQVCSWLCAIQFSVLKAAEQRNSLESYVEELRQKNDTLKHDSYLLRFYQAGAL